MSAHTKEPWEIYQTDLKDHPIGKFRIFRVKGNDAESICLVEKEADAVRIAACVNACAGLNPEAVPGMVRALELSYSSIERLLSNYRNPTEVRVIGKAIHEYIATALAEAKKVEEHNAS